MGKLNDLTVLVTASGAQFMPGLAHCLKDNGERNIRLIGTDMSNDPTIKQIVDVFYQVPADTDPNYTSILLDICKNEKVDVLMPFMSAELLNLIDRKEEFEAIGTKVSVSDRHSVEVTNNKYQFYAFLKEHGIKVPRFAPVRHSSELLAACEQCGYPQNGVCVKATELSGSRGIRIIKPGMSRFDVLFNEKPNSFFTSFEDLQATLNERPKMPEMMAMEYLPGEEGSVDLLAENGKIIGALGLTGNADLDFKADSDGHPVLMEINPRIAATMQIFKEGGLNLPYLRIKQLLGEKLPKIDIQYGVKMKRRYLEMFA